MNLIAITREFFSGQRIQSSDFSKDLCVSTIAMSPNGSPVLPWAGYLAEEQGVFVGTCGFKRLPELGEVEIAYFTFPEHEGQGVVTRMAQWLIDLANEKGVVRVKAQTLPERNASTRILEKLEIGVCSCGFGQSSRRWPDLGETQVMRHNHMLQPPTSRNELGINSG